METSAFARARNFLSYHPSAKWLAIVASVLSAFLFLALLLLLALFVDLVVNRGEIPPYHDLPVPERNAFLRRAALPEDSAVALARKQQVLGRLNELGVPPAALRDWLAGRPDEEWTHRERSLLWFVELPDLLEASVGERAAQSVWSEFRDNVARRGLDVALNQPIRDFGLLSLVTRTHSTFAGGLVRPLAAWNDWTWAYGNSYYLQGLFGLAVLTALVRAALMFLANYLAGVATVEAVTRLRRAVYHHTHRLGILAFRALGPGEAVSISTRHLEVVHDGLHLWLTVYFRAPVKFGLLLVFALLIHVWLALAFLLFALLVWVVGGQVASYFRRQGRAAETQAANQLVLIQESLTMTRLVKVYLMELFNQARVERQLSAYTDAQLRRYRGEAIYRPLFTLLGLLAAMVLLLAAGYVVMNGHLGVTSAVVLTTALVCLYWPATEILKTRRALRRSRESARALFAFLDKHGGVGQAIEAEFLPGLSKRLEFDNVTLQEPGTGRKLLQGVSLTVRAGQRVALVGPDELEKHALVYLLPRFLDPSSGEIRLDGKSLRWVTFDSLRAQIAMVLQPNLVFNDTVVNNIGCGDPAYNLHRVIEAAKVAHAHQFIQNLPQGYETPIGEQGHPLNASEKFRIALARAILRDPAILVIEEPLTPLDENAKDLIDDTYQRVLPGRTVIFLPHRLSTIRHCDQVFLLYQGRIEAAGDHRELLASSDLYKHLQYLEFNEFAGTLAPNPTPSA